MMPHVNGARSGAAKKSFDPILCPDLNDRDREAAERQAALCSTIFGLLQTHLDKTYDRGLPPKLQAQCDRVLAVSTWTARQALTGGEVLK